MATGEALICKLKNISPIDGADKIVQSNLFGETIIISKEYQEGQLGLLFDSETILDVEFCKKNNLFRHNHLNEDTTKTGYFEDSPRVRPIKLRGIKVSAFWIPIESLNYITTKYLPKEGTQIKEWKGSKICDKYIRPRIKQNYRHNKKQLKKVQQVINFYEHIDTDQLLRNLHKVSVGDCIVVTTKVHGTSCRVGLLPCAPKSWFKKLIKYFFNTKDKYYFVVGSRHVLKHVENQKVDKKTSFYEDDIWTDSAYRYFHGKLNYGETIYYEIVGFLPSGAPIMPSHSNECLSKFLSKQEYEDFLVKYGKNTTFSYGCSLGEVHYGENKVPISGVFAEYKIFVYRITLTTEHGQSIDLSWNQVKRRCEEMCVNYVPEIREPFFVTKANYKTYQSESHWIQETEQDCRFFPHHLNEGIVVRIENGNLQPQFYKNKRYLFKVLEGIIKDTLDTADIEESN